MGSRTIALPDRLVKELRDVLGRDFTLERLVIEFRPTAKAAAS